MHLPSLVNARRLAVGAASVGASVVIAAATFAGPADAGRAAHSSGVDKATKLTASLNGSREVPGPGDANGRGHVTITLKPGPGKVCATATWSKIGKPLAAHIHKGGPGVSGDVVVDLSTAVTGGSHCAAASAATIRKLSNHPGNYYFNIHTNMFQAGAIRGQLHG